VREARTCPACGFLLRYEDPPDASFSAARYVAVELLLWAALAFVLAFLWATPETSELYAVLATIAVAAWIYLRPRQRARAAALLERRRYHCAQCKRDFSAQDLRAAAD
jgi:L-asparagine transporter-like permease